MAVKLRKRTFAQVIGFIIIIYYLFFISFAVTDAGAGLVGTVVFVFFFF